LNSQEGLVVQQTSIRKKAQEIETVCVIIGDSCGFGQSPVQTDRERLPSRET
jgi:predicted PP-loop superfamily ATPase